MAEKAKSTASTSTSAGSDGAAGSSSSISASSINPNASNDALEKREKTTTTPTTQDREHISGDSEVVEDLPEVIVNKWSLNELKTACDDAVKQYLSRPDQFKPSHIHTDVRLFLGYSSSLTALGAAFYAYKVPNFQETRSVVLAAVVLFLVMSGMMNAYAKWIEGDTVFVGKRKVFAQGRIETQSISTRTSCAPYTPVYSLSLSYTHSSNGGKTLIRQFKKKIEKPFGEMFDENGKLVRNRLEGMLKGLLEEASSSSAGSA